MRKAASPSTAPMSSGPTRRWHPAGPGHAQKECHEHAERQKGPYYRHRQRAQSCVWLRPTLPRRGRRTGDHLSQCQGGALCASAGGALQSDIFMPCDVTVPGQLEAVYERVTKDWGRLDFVQHSIAYARKEDLHGRITDCSAEGFASPCRSPCIPSCGWPSSANR